jgi:hypothetical protein
MEWLFKTQILCYIRLLLQKITMTQAERIDAILKIKQDPSNETGEVRLINYKNETKHYPVYWIPLEFLVYNVVNGRIRSRTKSYQERFGELDPSDEDDCIIIEQFLFDSAKGRNEKTLESIEEIGQQESGIITEDGVVVDGNRRSMLVRMINRKNKSNIKFKAVILGDKLQDNDKEIIKLETSYQMGVDSKVDYNPIEKYIRCKELNTHYNIQEISSIMAEDERTINTWLERLDLMDNYLAYTGTPNVYTKLDKKEGHFVDLVQYLRNYSGGNSNVDWEYSDADIRKLKDIYFDYIRLGVPVMNARIIARPNLSRSFFCHKDIWTTFVEERDKVIDNVNEISLDKLKEDNPEETNESLIKQVEENWKEQVEDQLNEMFLYYSGTIDDFIADYAPLRLLQRANNSLKKIELEKLNAIRDNEINLLILEIETKIQEIK